MIGKAAYYKGEAGVVMDIMGDIAIIKLWKDMSEYTVNVSDLTIDASINIVRKDTGYLDKLAKELLAAGVTSLTIKDGEVKKSATMETLEEKIERYKTEAEVKAKKEYEEEQSKEK